jgi:metal-dependent amidase/aminoacylase/carboxypeptidase family protein
MPIINSIAAMHDDITGWRRYLHENPELMYDVHNTAAFVVDKLRAFGVDDIATGIGKTGVVGVIRGRYGCAADRGDHGARLRFEGHGQDARLRP